jgi:hypothetical protein
LYVFVVMRLSSFADALFVIAPRLHRVRATQWPLLGTREKSANA